MTAYYGCNVEKYEKFTFPQSFTVTDNTTVNRITEFYLSKLGVRIDFKGKNCQDKPKQSYAKYFHNVSPPPLPLRKDVGFCISTMYQTCFSPMASYPH